MSKAENGNTVKVHYTGTLNDGTEFDSSSGREPLEFTIGSGQIIPGFDSGVVGMVVNEKKSIKITAAEAYGDVREELIVNVPKSDLPEDINPQVGMTLEVHTEDGQKLPVFVSDVADDSITIDGNHPLAGQELNFEIELVEIKE